MKNVLICLVQISIFLPQSPWCSITISAHIEPVSELTCGFESAERVLGKTVVN